MSKKYTPPSLTLPAFSSLSLTKTDCFLSLIQPENLLLQASFIASTVVLSAYFSPILCLALASILLIHLSSAMMCYTIPSFAPYNPTHRAILAPPYI